MECYKSLIGGR